VNTTITGNTATNSSGAAVYATNHTSRYVYVPTLSIVHSTIAGNTGGSVGGVRAELKKRSNVSIKNTVIADNTRNQCGFRASPAVSSGSASSDSSCNGFAYNRVSPGLRTLTDNGGARPIGPNGTRGRIQTMAIDSTSPLRDRADSAHCAAADARGVTRPQGGGCDIGAYETR